MQHNHGGLVTSLIAALFAAISAVTLSPVSAASAAEPTRVLIVGDSVTHGLRGDYTWRYFAWRALQQTGASVDFVGPHAGTNGIEPALFFSGPYADPTFDTDHAGRWGMAMREMLDTPDTTSPAIGDLVASQDPDVVVEQLGVNDFDRLDLTATTMVGQVRRFVADARAAKADVEVVLGSIPQTWLPEVKAYNAALPGLAAELTTNGSRVVSTPVADFTEGVDTYDFAHPTTDGQRKIAAAVSVALEQLGLGAAVTMPAPAVPGPNDPVQQSTAPAPTPAAAPSTPTAEPTVTAPAPTAPLVAPRRVRAVDRGARVAVSWRMVESADRYVVRCGSKARTTSASKALVRSAAGRCKVRAVNGSGASAWAVTRVR